MEEITDPSNWERFQDWLGSSGVRIVIIIAVTWLLERFAAAIVGRIVHGAMNPDHYASEREESLRERTVTELVTTVTRIGLIAVAAMVILTELNIDIGPLLASAGIVGFAVGFGAQSLIKDFIAGVFIVMENQYRVGDVVRINGVEGQVRRISTRITVLRDLGGNVHYIPNGTINLATNLTMGYAKINMDISVTSDTDAEKLKKVVNKVGEQLIKDEQWAEFITEAPYFTRIVDLSGPNLIFNISGKTLPAKQWVVEGELRLRLKEAFEKNHIALTARPAGSGPAKPAKK